MNVTAWKNGRNNNSNVSYGLKISVTDRDKHFHKSWKSVFITLPNGIELEVNTNKESFWNDTCRELISKGIGIWFLEDGYVPWSKGKPPKFELLPQGERYFRLQEKET